MKTIYNFYTISLEHLFSIGIVETDVLLEYEQYGNWKIKEKPEYLLNNHELELLQLNNKRKYKFIRKIGKAKIINNHKVLPYLERKAL